MWNIVENVPKTSLFSRIFSPKEYEMYELEHQTSSCFSLEAWAILSEVTWIHLCRFCLEARSSQHNLCVM